jgi:hypothetical protein
VETEPFLEVASELLAVPSTADRPQELLRALEFGEGLHGPAEFADVTTIAPYYLALTSCLNGPR